MPRKQLIECSVDGCERKPHAKGLCKPHYVKRWRYGNESTPDRRKNKEGSHFKWLKGVLETAHNECVIWPWARCKNGYAGFKKGGQWYQAHRWVCEQVNGPPPTSAHHAAHECGNGKMGCVNPNHLRWKTATENEADKAKHGTLMQGEKNPRTILTRKQVLEIYEIDCPLRRASFQEIAQQYGVDWPVIEGIKRGSSWTWLTQHGTHNPHLGSAQS